MQRYLRHLAVAALLGGTLTGCSDFLSGPSIDEDPNNPTVDVTSADNLFVGFQATQFANFNSTLAMTICGWMQQCKGAPGSGRFIELQLNEYQLDPQTFDTEWNQVYSTGGLLDIRTVRQKLEARSVRDPLYEGITKVWEALIISEAADKWGDIPYSEAARPDEITNPALDDQLAVYTALRTLLDEAIAQINDPSPDAVGPGSLDFVYGSDPAAWTALARTLKARILLHTVRAQCANLNGCAVYTQIINELAPGGPGTTVGLPVDGSMDFTTVTSGASALESNGWWQIYAQSGFGPDLRAGDFIVNLMQTRNGGNQDPRFNTYFTASMNCVPSIANPALGLAIARSCLPSGASFSQPWVTGDENALILAEAYFNTGNTAAAQGWLDAVRNKYGVTLEPVSLEEIVEEKYVTLFQNPEVWNDYKRTCLPALTPTSNQGPIQGLIPRRLFYGEREQLGNINMPDATTQQGPGGPNLPNFRNDNDPPPPQGCAPISL